MKYALKKENDIYFCGTYTFQGGLYDTYKTIKESTEEPNKRYKIKTWKSYEKAKEYLDKTNFNNCEEYSVVEFKED